MPRVKKKIVQDPMTFPGEGDIVLDKRMSANDPYIGMVPAERSPGERGILGPQEAVERLDGGLGKDDMGPGSGTDRGGPTPGGDVGPGPQLGGPPGTGTPEPEPVDPGTVLPRRGTGPGTQGPPPRTEDKPVVEEPKPEVRTTIDVITAIPTPIMPSAVPRAGGGGGGAAGGASAAQKKKAFPWWLLLVAAGGLGAWWYYKKRK